VYVDDSKVREAEEKWGVPVEGRFVIPTTAAELAFIRSTQKRGRAHDVTLIAWDEEHRRFAVIAKHAYAAGAFRPPSGGIEPGESFEEGARREAREETGLDVELTRYVLRARVRFEPGGAGAVGGGRAAAADAAAGGRAAPADAIEWVTHVFEASAIGSRLAPIDVHEIREASWATREELLGPLAEKLLLRDSAGIRYRVALHRAIFAAIDARSTRALDGSA
jgi:8-oxo-dGTP pyrophosphatase MutT (NUDIX family)